MPTSGDVVPSDRGSSTGEIAADLAMGTASPFDLSLFAPERFSH